MRRGIATQSVRVEGIRRKRRPSLRMITPRQQMRSELRIRDFEKDAIAAKSPRFTGETVKEWFSRMGWVQNDALFDTYNKARYGSFSITEEEGRQFVSNLQEIKNKYFPVDV